MAFEAALAAAAEQALQELDLKRAMDVLTRRKSILQGLADCGFSEIDFETLQHIAAEITDEDLNRNAFQYLLNWQIANNLVGASDLGERIGAVDRLQKYIKARLLILDTTMRELLEFVDRTNVHTGQGKNTEQVSMPDLEINLSNYNHLFRTPLQNALRRSHFRTFAGLVVYLQESGGLDALTRMRGVGPVRAMEFIQVFENVFGVSLEEVIRHYSSQTECEEV